jgi:hypothetical protein
VVVEEGTVEEGTDEEEEEEGEEGEEQANVHRSLRANSQMISGHRRRRRWSSWSRRRRRRRRRGKLNGEKDASENGEEGEAE